MKIDLSPPWCVIDDVKHALLFLHFSMKFVFPVTHQKNLVQKPEFLVTIHFLYAFLFLPLQIIYTVISTIQDHFASSCERNFSCWVD